MTRTSARAIGSRCRAAFKTFRTRRCTRQTAPTACLANEAPRNYRCRCSGKRKNGALARLSPQFGRNLAAQAGRLVLRHGKLSLVFQCFFAKSFATKEPAVRSFRFHEQSRAAALGPGVAQLLPWSARRRCRIHINPPVLARLLTGPPSKISETPNHPAPAAQVCTALSQSAVAQAQQALKRRDGARGEIRTRTPAKAEDFESPASTVPPLGPGAWLSLAKARRQFPVYAPQDVRRRICGSRCAPPDVRRRPARA